MTVSGVMLGSAFYAAVSAYRHAVSMQSANTDAAMELQWFSVVSLAMMLVGLANSMLIAVAERFREIGTLKCLGASDITVLGITLLECGVLALFGSAVGVAAGFWAGAKMAGSTPYWAAAPLPFITCFGVSLLASLLPGIAAARIPASAALRSEV